jgi:hypothetical protein
MTLLTDDIREKLLRNGRLRDEYAREGKAEPDFLPVVKLFMPRSGAAWLLTELDPEEQDIAFGLCDLGMGYPELGYVSLSEIALAAEVTGLDVQRDDQFIATKTLSAYADEARARGGITVGGAP